MVPQQITKMVAAGAGYADETHSGHERNEFWRQEIPFHTAWHAGIQLGLTVGGGTPYRTPRCSHTSARQDGPLRNAPRRMLLFTRGLGLLFSNQVATAGQVGGRSSPCGKVAIEPARFGRVMKSAQRALLAIAIAVAPSAPVVALDRIALRRDGSEIHLAGQCLVTAEDGGLLVETRDGVLWAVTPDELIAHTTNEEPFEPYSADELASRLVEELPQGFAVHETRRYLVCYNTSRAYAEWCGALFERLYLAFMNYWSRRDFDVTEPEAPLVAIVFGDRKSYAQYAQTELGEHASRIIGYYSLRTNRMTMYDLTGIEGLRQSDGRRGSPSQINRMLSRPQAERTVATIIHEATHQIAFNCGLQTRYADIPLWLSEGVAVYFETPDLKSRKGWRTIGGINRFRLEQFRKYLQQRPANSLKSLITDDSRLRDPRRADAAYAEAWALSHFLIRQRPEQFRAYLKRLAEKGRLVYDTPEERLAEFCEAFGADLSALDAQFTRHVGKLR